MKTFSKVLMVGITTCMATASLSTQAEGVGNQIYAGLGFSHNRVDLETFGGSSESASGSQFFGGYKMGQRNGFDLSLELGYMETGSFDDDLPEDDLAGVWLAGLAKKNLPEIDSRLSALVRGGVDLGDDDGLIMGFGAEFKVHPRIFLRAEYLNKDITQSYQFNAGFEF